MTTRTRSTRARKTNKDNAERYALLVMVPTDDGRDRSRHAIPISEAEIARLTEQLEAYPGLQSNLDFCEDTLADIKSGEIEPGDEFDVTLRLIKVGERTKSRSRLRPRKHDED